MYTSYRGGCGVCGRLIFILQRSLVVAFLGEASHFRGYIAGDVHDNLIADMDVYRNEPSYTLQLAVHLLEALIHRQGVLVTSTTVS
jgi:hypothetical protein